MPDRKINHLDSTLCANGPSSNSVVIMYAPFMNDRNETCQSQAVPPNMKSEFRLWLDCSFSDLPPSFLPLFFLPSRYQWRMYYFKSALWSVSLWGSNATVVCGEYVEWICECKWVNKCECESVFKRLWVGRICVWKGLDVCIWEWEEWLSRWMQVCVGEHGWLLV